MKVTINILLWGVAVALSPIIIIFVIIILIGNKQVEAYERYIYGEALETLRKKERRVK